MPAHFESPWSNSRLMTTQSRRGVLTDLTRSARSFAPFVFWFGLFCIPATNAVGQIGVSPPRSEFSLDGPATTHTIRVFNVGDKTVEIGVEVYHWELDEQNKVQIVPPTEQSLDQWMVINPLRFTLEPGGSQAVRFAARPRVKPEPGEHRALVYFQQEPDADMIANPDQPRILFRLGTSVIGLVEPIVREAVVHSVTADSKAVNIDIESRGNTHVRTKGQLALWPVDEFPGHENTGLIEGLGEDEELELPEGMASAWPLNTLPVLPESRRTVTTLVLSTNLEPGSYVLDLHGTVADTDIGRVFDIEVVAPPPKSETDTPPGQVPESEPPHSPENKTSPTG